MRGYSDIRDELVRPVVQALANTNAGLERARQTHDARETSRRTLEEAVQSGLQAHRELDAPQTAIKSEIGDLEARARDVQRQLEAKRHQLQALVSESEQRAQDIRKLKGDIAAADAEVRRAADEVARKQGELDATRNRLAETSLLALRRYCEDVFSSLQASAATASALERYDNVRAAYEKARHSDPVVMSAHEERLELRRHLDASQVPAVRELLAHRLKSVEGVIAARFPGYLEGPPPSEDEELLETFFWYDGQDDLTSIVLPVPASCWHTPPVSLDDPRGQFCCQLLWAFAQSMGEPVPTIECAQELVTLEWHGDLTSRVADATVSVKLQGGRAITFVPTLLPEEIREALT